MRPDRREIQPSPKLTDLNLDLELADKNNPKKDSEQQVLVEIDEVKFNLEIRKSSYAGATETTGSIKIRASEIGKESLPAGFLSIEIRIRPGEDCLPVCSITSDVVNHDRYLPALGRNLWELIPKFAQKFADDNKISATHLIRKSPGGTLKPGKWDEIFLPILEKHRYSRIKQTSATQKNKYGWQKKYLPEG